MGLSFHMPFFSPGLRGLMFLPCEKKGFYFAYNRASPHIPHTLHLSPGQLSTCYTVTVTIAVNSTILH